MTKLEYLSKKADKIYLDADSTLLATNEAMTKILNRRYNKTYTGADVTNWYYTDLYPTNAEEIEEIFNSAELFRNINFTKGARKYLTKYRDKIIIITKSGFRNYLHKRLWFNNHGFKDIPIIPIPLNMSKSVINMKGGLFIDDCAYNLKESNATYKLMFMEYDDNKDRDWQRNWKRGRITEWL